MWGKVCMWCDLLAEYLKYPASKHNSLNVKYPWKWLLGPMSRRNGTHGEDRRSSLTEMPINLWCSLERDSKSNNPAAGLDGGKKKKRTKVLEKTLVALSSQHCSSATPPRRISDQMKDIVLSREVAWSSESEKLLIPHGGLLFCLWHKLVHLSFSKLHDDCALSQS